MKDNKMNNIEDIDPITGGNFSIIWKFKDLPYELADNYVKTGTEVYTSVKKEEDKNAHLDRKKYISI